MRAVFWTTEETQAFEEVKKALANATLLSHPHPGALLRLIVDASDTGVGAVLHQHIYGRAEPLAFYSKSLQPQETRYSTLGRRHLPREQWHLDFILKFTANIRHIKGENNVVNAFLRVFTLSADDSNASKLDFTLLDDAQQRNIDMQQLRTVDTGLQLRDVPLPNLKTLISDTLTNQLHWFVSGDTPRLYLVPASYTTKAELSEAGFHRQGTGRGNTCFRMPNDTWNATATSLRRSFQGTPPVV
ncbi:pol Retrovirus-related Pol polyprotein from transposon-like 18 [Homarus americanus]|uniref:Pol Retrovirus-related Pol polyprotein from transposon-like 18 n=1 Tax=Homarus americanus TaxID=6706 RepID=A0A8J5MUK9_HOMAM|nr:pol Retrovirus-related Pol polyprotein from transposon-like 18 [Homarus americanus]